MDVVRGVILEDVVIDVVGYVKMLLRMLLGMLFLKMLFEM